jgi:hypothetical protein
VLRVVRSDVEDDGNEEVEDHPDGRGDADRLPEQTENQARRTGQFNRLLFQVLLDPALAIEGERMRRAQTRLRRVLPERAD